MTPLTREVVIYSVQIALLVGAGTLAMRASGFSYPQAHLACWRLVLAVCLLLPLWPAHVVHVTAPAGKELFQLPTSESAAFVASAPRQPQSWTFVMLLNQVPLLIVVGAIARASWLAAGLLSLRRLASFAGGPVDSARLVDLHARLGSQALMRWHTGINQPVTFGRRRPVVLLPASFKDKPIDVQAAALSHELLHVERGDWVAGILEQAVLCAFWFHPAVWWAVDQLELHREEVVDDLSIAAVGSRKTYLRALLEFAEKPAPRAALAFGHRQLAKRIQHLSREIVMTRSRFAISTAALTAVIVASAIAVASALPMRTTMEYQVVAVRAFDPNVIRPPAVNGPAVMRVPAEVTPSPTATGAKEGDRQTNDGQQQVSARLQPVIAAVDARGILPQAAYPAHALKFGVGATIAMTAMVTTARQVVDITPAGWSLTIDREITDVGYWASSPQQAFIDACADALGRWEPPPYPDETMVRVTFTFRPTATVLVNIERRGADGFFQPVGPSFSSQQSSDLPRVGGNIRTPNKTVNVDPVYPPLARDAGVSGVVTLDTTIGADGSVIDAMILRSVPLLDQAALDAVRQWRYEPPSVNGQATAVRMIVTINFSLRK